MAFTGQLAQDIDHAGLDPQERMLLDPDRLGDPIGGLEADPIDVLGQPVRIFLDNSDGGFSVGFEDLGGIGGGDAMALQENHDLPDLFLLLPGGSDSLKSDLADSIHGEQAGGLLLDDAQGVDAKDLHQPFGEDRTDPFDETGAQILLDAGKRAGAKMQAMLRGED